MTRRGARALARLYARDWRARYGDEFEALLREMPASPVLYVDVVAHALATRRREIALVAALVLTIIGLSAISHPSRSGERVAEQRTAARSSAACRSYSSVSPNGWIARQQCMD